MDDGRRATITLEDQEAATFMEVTFELENENTHEVQRGGWQAILDNFKKYAESQK
jgi:hypothetical protein